MIYVIDPHSTISSDPISPHLGHKVGSTDEGQWVCVTCDPDVIEVACRVCGVVYVSELDVNEVCPYCDTNLQEELPL